ncbi:MAG TPA: hypothetical protein VEK15_09670 [Vicinamibacteria bacterium]|nr:hypothetical protein [Vicinamibacteria bacterium]
MNRTKKTRWILTIAATTLVSGLCIGALAHVARRSESQESLPLTESHLKWVPSSATLAGHVNLRALAESPLFEAWRLREEARTGLEALSELRRRTGIDPLTDLDTATFSVVESAQASPNSPPEHWGVSVRGAIDGTHLLRELRKHGEVVSGEYEGIAVHEFTDRRGRELAFAVASADTLLVGGPDYLRQMLDAGAGKEPSVGLETLLEGIDGPSLRNETFWVVGKASKTIGSLLSTGPGSDLPSIRSFALSGRIARDLQLKAQGKASDAVAAQQLADVARGMAALGRLREGMDPTFLSVLESVSIAQLDDRIEISVTVPNAAMERLLESNLEKAHPDGNLR